MNTADMGVELMRGPGLRDYHIVKEVALATIGKRPVNEPKEEWLAALADAEHSPVRMLRFVIRMWAPYWVLNELRTHHVGAEMWMQSSRNDRQNDFDRGTAPQGMTRIAIWEVNLQALMDVMHRRLCGCASSEMQTLAGMIAGAVIDQYPWTEKLLVPMCEYRGGVCHEMQCCGRCPKKE